MESLQNRPRAVTWLLVIVLTFTGGQLLRAVTALQDWAYLSALPLSVSPLYITLRGLGWAAVGALIAWALYQSSAWAPRALRLGSLAFALFYWLERGLLQASEIAGTNRPFALGASILLLLSLYWLVSRPGARAYFGDRDE